MPLSYDTLRDREEIARVLLQDPVLNIYGIGDLDDRFWPYTTWYGRRLDGRVSEIAFIYAHVELPVLIALSRDPPEGMTDLLRGISSRLPRRFHAHTGPGVVSALAPAFHRTPRGEHIRMSLEDPNAVRGWDPAGVVALTPGDLPEVEDLYAASYPGNWFDPWMIETGCYFGIRDPARLVAVAGVHVVSAGRGAAALGNIATHPGHRGKGYATAATAVLVRHLTMDLGISRIGLNVRSDNVPAIACYTKLGFREAARYEESLLEAR